ncbi:MAG: hypothetical protein KAS66_06130 [Candidatus Omnitrophica bacterium]|nr:hypothetical protein [Candidatus Omnitrophota bacterium]
MTISESIKRYIQSEKGKATAKAWRESDAGKASIARRKAKYKASAKGKLKIKAYRKSEKAKVNRAKCRQAPEQKAMAALWERKWVQTEKGKESLTHSSAKYAKTPKGKITRARSASKRKKDMGYNSINTKFEDSDGHHLNKSDVVFIPTELHKSIWHRQINPTSMKLINDVAFEWLCTQEAL